MAAVHGTCDPAFAKVREALEQNLRERGEVGAGVAIEVDGEIVVDLWGGERSADTGEPWERDTLVCVFSVTKALAALCVHLLIDRGEVALDRPVADYWPEFAQAGKESVTVRTLLGGLAGLPFPDHAPDGSLFDQAAMADALARQAPEWPPGTQGAYHGATFGCLLGELVERVSAAPLADFFRDEIANVWGLDAHIALADVDLDRVARLFIPPGPWERRAERGTKAWRAWRPRPAIPDLYNSRTFRQSGFASAAGHATARSLARLFGVLACGGERDGKRLLTPAEIAELRALQWEGICGFTDRPFRMALGLFLNNVMMPMGPNPAAFGHAGRGGALAFADPETRLSFGYTPNALSPTDDVGDRCRALVEAVYTDVLGKAWQADPIAR